MTEPNAIVLTIGTRGMLTRRSAKEAADKWNQLRRQWPQAAMRIHLFGYDDDPRPIWEIPEAASYVRLWARLAKIRDAQDVLAQIGEEGVSLLVACGVPGKNVKVVLPSPKTTKH